MSEALAGGTPVIQIRAGSFFMGDETGNPDECPVHEVTIGTFLIGKCTVTNEEFRKFLNATGHPFPDHYLNEPNFCNSLQPVVAVSWFDATEYCRWLSQTTGRRYRLPTEAEWEYTARSGSPENVYPWGKEKWDQLPELHHCFQNGPEKVGSFRANSFGIHDMGFNVHEWCQDWYDAAYYQQSPALSPTGPATGTRRASRGGSWRHQIKITRCAARSSIPPDYRYADYGFRVLREINQD
jgi:formylglycine-generating enzyme required for sulfatase activity